MARERGSRRGTATAFLSRRDLGHEREALSAHRVTPGIAIATERQRQGKPIHLLAQSI